MRRFVTLAVLLLFTVPFGISISGCAKKTTIVYCNGGDSGVVVGSLTTITLQPKVYGYSLSYAQKGQIGTPAGTDCKGTTVTVSAYRYGTTDMTLADVNPTTGALCAGTWNKNTGGAIADYTTCVPTNKSGVAYVTAAAGAVSSNPLPVYIHPVVTSVVLGAPSTNCSTDPDPSTNCCPVAANATTSAPAYSSNTCLSQGVTGQLSARVYQNGTTNPADNISCLVGHLTYTPQTASIVTIDENGVATAVAPGSTIISATVASTPSSAGFFSTCPPASITLTNPGPSVVNQNNTQALNSVIKDTNGVSLTGLNLEYVSTTPTTIPASSAASVTPTFPGAASIFAICAPGTCNPSPFTLIGQLGNGKPIVSNPISITTPGTTATVLYIASTQSQYLVPVDFTTTTLGTPVRLPYIPNSMVISQDGTTIYLGSSTELMVFNATSNAVSREDVSSPGNVLAVSPDGGTVVISDPVRKITTLETAAGAVITTYGAVGTHAEWSPDSQAVYIAAGSQLLVYSTFTGWDNITQLTSPVTDVALTVPSVGAYFAGGTTTARGYCASTTSITSGTTTAVANEFYPLADTSAAVTDRIAATNDGKHILGVTATTAVPTLSDLHVTIPNQACPATGGLTFGSSFTTATLPGIAAASITGVVPASDSSIAFVTYTGTGGVIPTYVPSASGVGTVGSIKLSGTAIAPVSGVFSTDNLSFYAGTTGDNLVHIINRATLTDGTTIAPKLPDTSGNLVAPNLLVQRPRKATQ